MFQNIPFWPKMSKNDPNFDILGSMTSKTWNLLQKHGNFIIFEGSATPQNDPFLDPFFDPLFHPLAKNPYFWALNNPGISRTCQKGVQKVTFPWIPGPRTFWKVKKMGFWQIDPFFGRFWRFSRFWQKWHFWHLSVISLRFWRFSRFWRFWPFLKNRVSKWPHFLPFLNPTPRVATLPLKSCFWGVPKPWKWPIFDQIRSKPEIFSRCEGTLFLFSKWKNMSFTATKYFRFWPKLSKICHFLDPPRFSHFLTNLVTHFLKPQDVRKWHILGHFWTPFLTTPWQIPTQIGYPPGASRSWPSKRGLILTPLFGLSRYCPIRGIYPHFLTHFWIKNGQKTGPKHLVFWGSRQKTLSRSQK